MAQLIGNPEWLTVISDLAECLDCHLCHQISLDSPELKKSKAWLKDHNPAGAEEPWLTKQHLSDLAVGIISGIDKQRAYEAFIEASDLICNLISGSEDNQQ